MSYRDSGPIPNRWLKCPRKASGLVAGKFLAFKTPLGHQFNDKVPEENRFTPSMLFVYMKSLKVSHVVKNRVDVSDVLFVSLVQENFTIFMFTKDIFRDIGSY